MEVILKLSAREALDSISAGLVTPLLELCAGSHNQPDQAKPEQKAAIPAVPTAPVIPDAAPAVPTAPVPPAVPTEQHSYTRDELAVAAGQLMNSGKQSELLGLLQQFGVPSLMQLQADQYGAFATALRGLGAKI